ncbi:esterase-like activity of phytase family protein [Sphingomonas sp.]|uniref:esterase-like activity of phytase family protein n=1 Tax=Sphingomonas sp. TaxID=28214 RepID=UPI001D977C93|nr:esterase-like activity of phytase family protein [Sphingomonas sp.]MBX9796876.1 esterase-like activity of phytase family protein [Sphingomonas sp.]
MRLFWSILFVLLFCPAWSVVPPARHPTPGVPFAAERVFLYPGQPGERRLGVLHYVRGYRLTSPDREFGGFSAMLTDGRHFTLLGDGGDGVIFTLGGDGVPRAQRWFSLPAGPGSGWEKRDRDSESLVRDGASGRLWVGFENWNQIWRYAPGFARAERHAAPPDMAGWDENRGAEAMVRLRDGRFIIFNETDGWPGRKGRAGLIFAGDPTEAPRAAARFTYLPPPGFNPTDATELPDGRLILINRRFSLLTGFDAVLTLVDPDAIQPGAVVEGVVLARFVGHTIRDNFEAVAAVQEADGTHLWLASDANQLPIEQNLLLEFRIDEAELAATLKASPVHLKRQSLEARASSRSDASAGGRAATAARRRP